MEHTLSRQRFRWGLLGLLLVYLCGWIAPLFENDSAQFAVMAMRMVNDGDFLSLYKGPNPYLDKPHMHYWISALSLKVFGINDWAYRFTGLLAAVVAGISVYGLGRELYDRCVGRLATWIFLSFQTIVLSFTDLRTDAWLTAFIALAIWQWAIYNRRGTWQSLLLCAFGTGLAFSTKGHIALVVIGSSVLADLIYTRGWRRILNPWMLVAISVFALSISPVLYAYYQQFDLHPELVIRGRDNRSGIWFILWEQSFERMSGEGIGKNSPDYFFFFHTFLWVILPWTIYGLIAIFGRMWSTVRRRFRFRPNKEFLTLGTLLLVFPLISAAQFKLPHYLNILMPVTAVLIASYLSRPGLYRINRVSKALMGVAVFVYSVSTILVWILTTWVFPLTSWGGYLLLVLATAFGLALIFRRENTFMRLSHAVLYTSLLLNFTLNMHFYPQLLKYQSGSSMAKLIKEEGIPADRIYKLSEAYTWALDFYLGEPVKEIGEEGLKDLSAGSYIYAEESERSRLQTRANLELVGEVDYFRITRLSIKFLNPETRPEVLGKRYLLRVVD